MENINIQLWDKEKFFRSRDEWNDLLQRSSADPLFLSWEWQSSWWRFFSDAESMELKLFVATDSQGKILGIAPLYTTNIITKRIIKSTRLQFIGNCWRGKPTMPTELLEFIVDNTQSKEVISTLLTHIYSLNIWDEFVIPYLKLNSETCRILITENLLPQCYFRHAEKYDSYYLSIGDEFENYINGLGKNTRLKLFNRRKLLDKMGAVTLNRMISTHIEENFTLLNELHYKRWKKLAFNNQRLDFNISVASLMAEKNCLNFSVLSLNDEPVSIQYNFLINKHNYNIQAGFDENFHKKISLGYLHFGYEIEASFRQNDSTYDFLAGEGKNTQYKKRLTETCQQLTDLHIIRKPALIVLYKFYNFVNR